MKKVILILILAFVSSCSNQKNIIGSYMSSEEPTSYNIILDVKADNRYTLKSVATIGSGVTEGTWISKEKNLILMPDKFIPQKVVFQDTIVETEEFRPFADTIEYIIKTNKLILLHPSNSPKVLFRRKNK